MTKILCVGLLLTLGGCGARSIVQTEGETHWLTSCAEGESCGGGQTCVCGVCTQSCEASRDCREVSRSGACAAITETRYYNECQSELPELSICVRGDDVVAPTSVDAGNKSPTEGTTGDVDSTSESSEVDATWPDVTACDAGTCAASPHIVMVAAGAGHTCVVLEAGGVKCWGENEFGQLGTDTTQSQYSPTDVEGLTTGVRAITAGSAHTCAVLTDDSVQCWGYNAYGQLGNGNTTDQLAPVPVDGLDAGVSAIVAGSASAHTCALMMDGEVKCWGRGLAAPGDAGPNDQTTPADVVGLSAPATSLAVGQDVTCALLTTGGVECWGDNYYGQLGNGSTESSTAPLPVSGLTEGVLAIASANAHVCALLTSGEMKCWGYNFNSEVGTDEGNTHLLPRVVEGVTDVSAMALGALHTCVLLTTGGVQCWGHGEFGALGNDDATTSAQPVDAVGLTEGITTLAAGQYHNCAALASGGLVCWGNNTGGQLGLGSVDPRYQFVPAPVIGLR